MEGFLFDTHVHTAESSFCGVLGAEETVRLYRDAGFSGICVTDHYCPTYGHQKLKDILKGYHRAAQCGRELGVDVLLGIELRLRGSLNDYLLFGVTEDFLRAYPRLCEYTMAEMSALMRANDVLVFQAHPFRTMCQAASPQYLDGVEAVNGNPRHNSRNGMAADYARAHGLYASAGSDCHQLEDAGRNGIITTERIRNLDMLKEALKSPETRLYAMEG